MKKVLLGLLATSAVTMSAPTDLTQVPGAGKTVFEGTQEGAITITGKVTSTVPPVKYVVYASENNGATKEDVLALKDFIISTKNTTAGFIAPNPKVYVKKVVSNGVAMDVANLDSTDKVLFKVKFPDFPVFDNTLGIAQGVKLNYSPMAFVPKSVSEDIINSNAILRGVSLDEGGWLYDGNNYIQINAIELTQKEQGVLEILNTDYTGTMVPSEEKGKAFVAGFSDKKQIATGAKILVKVN